MSENALVKLCNANYAFYFVSIEKLKYILPKITRIWWKKKRKKNESIRFKLRENTRVRLLEINPSREKLDVICDILLLCYYHYESKTF